MPFDFSAPDLAKMVRRSLLPATTSLSSSLSPPLPEEEEGGNDDDSGGGGGGDFAGFEGESAFGVVSATAAAVRLLPLRKLYPVLPWPPPPLRRSVRRPPPRLGRAASAVSAVAFFFSPFSSSRSPSFLFRVL